MLNGCKYDLFFVTLLITVSCTNYVVERDGEIEYINSLSFDTNSSQDILEEYADEDLTRGIVWYSGSASFGTSAVYTNHFEHWDTIGIFPTIGDQIPFPLTTIPIGTEQSSFTFSATGWRLRNDIKYYAYWPFSRKNYTDGNNKEHIYVKYYGQIISPNTGETTTGNLKMNTGMLDSVHCQYSYLYSKPTQAAAGSNNLSFSMQYLGGVLRLKGYCSNIPSNISVDTMRIIYFQIVAPDDRFILEGSYDLENVAETGVVSITPSARGKSNKITFKLDNVHATKNIASSGAVRGQFFALCFLHPVKVTGVTFYAYDQNYNCYQYKYTTNNKTISSSNTLYLNGMPLKYVYTATPDSIKFQPWGDEEETINSNWNYK